MFEIRVQRILIAPRPRLGQASRTKRLESRELLRSEHLFKGGVAVRTQAKCVPLAFRAFVDDV